MANEIQGTFALAYTPGSPQQPANIAQFTEQVTQSSTHKMTRKTIVIPTSDTAISLSELSTLGKVWVANLDAVNYVEIGPDSGGSIVPMHKIKPGEMEWFRLVPGITLRGQANTASVEIDIFALND